MIKFMRYKWLYFALSGLFIIPGIISLFTWGLKPSIDFTGGALWELKIEKPKDKLEKTLKEAKFSYSSIAVSNKNTYILKTKPLDIKEKSRVKIFLGEKLGKVEEVRFETIGPVLGKELIKKTVYGILIASFFILLYVATRFKERIFGICAILAMFHDSFLLLGVFSLLGHFLAVEIDTLFVTALLTILSFSVHDTVVVYDRIRESRKHYPNMTIEELSDKAVTETITRSLNNSLTIIFMLLALFLIGGESIRWFTFALLIGTISGTYSSTFTAVPLLVVLDDLKRKKPGGN